jgi:hypothetical protein
VRDHKWLLSVTLSVVDSAELPQPERLQALPLRLGWPTSRILTRGQPIHASSPLRLYKRSGFDVRVYEGHDEPVVPRISDVLNMLETPGVDSLLKGLERSVTVAIKFLTTDTPSLVLEHDLVRRMAQADLTYDLDLYLWNVPDSPNSD